MEGEELENYQKLTKFQKDIGIIGLGDSGDSLALEIELIKLTQRGINFIMVDDFEKKENKMVDDFIQKMTSLPINEILPKVGVGEFTEKQTKKAIEKKKWKQMTFKERKKLKPL